MNKAIKRIFQGLSFCLIGLVCSAQATDGTVKTKVKFIQYTCSLTAASKNMRVPLGEINRSQLSKKGSLSSPVSFELKATDCPTEARAQVSVVFSGSAPQEDARAFVLDQDSMASGVAVKIASGYSSNYNYFIKPNSLLDGHQFSVISGEVIMNYVAQYVALNDHVTPGTANLTTQIDLNYW